LDWEQELAARSEPKWIENPQGTLRRVKSAGYDFRINGVWPDEEY
jgi:hypothetical protein